MSGLRVRLGAGAVAVLATVAVRVVAASAHTRTGSAVDDRTYSLLLDLPEWLRAALNDFARPVVIVVLAPVVAYLALRALVRRRPAAALTAALVPLGATFAAHLIHADEIVRVAPWTFPSTHATLGAGLLVGVVVTWPRHVAWWGALLAGVTLIALSAGNVTGHAHYPVDVAGSLCLVVAAWAACVAVLGRGAANLEALQGGTSITGRGADAQPETDRHTAA